MKADFANKVLIHVFFLILRPAVKATFDITLVVDKNKRALSNMVSAYAYK